MSAVKCETGTVLMHEFRSMGVFLGIRVPYFNRIFHLPEGHRYIVRGTRDG